MICLLLHDLHRVRIVSENVKAYSSLILKPEWNSSHAKIENYKMHKVDSNVRLAISRANESRTLQMFAMLLGRLHNAMK